MNEHDLQHDLRAYADSLGFSWPSEEGYDFGGLFWKALTGYGDPPWYGGSSGVFRLPAVRQYAALLTLYLAGRRRSVYVVFAQTVLELERRCPPILTAEASRLLAVEVEVVPSEELTARILRRNLVQDLR